MALHTFFDDFTYEDLSKTSDNLCNGLRDLLSKRLLDNLKAIVRMMVKDSLMLILLSGPLVSVMHAFYTPRNGRTAPD